MRIGENPYSGTFNLLFHITYSHILLIVNFCILWLSKNIAEKHHKSHSLCSTFDSQSTFTSISEAFIFSQFILKIQNLSSFTNFPHIFFSFVKINFLYAAYQILFPPKIQNTPKESHYMTLNMHLAATFDTNKYL